MKRLYKGAIAGFLGGIAMKTVVQVLDRNAFGLSANTDAIAVCQIWRRLGWEAPERKQAERIGAALHYAFATAAGIAYSAASDVPMVRAGRGSAFGVALWLIGDEVAVSVAGLEDPRQTPLASHVSALAAHVLYGFMVELLNGQELAGRSPKGLYGCA